MDGQILPLPVLPAGPPPAAGVYPNFIDPWNRAPSLIACNVILLVVSTLVVGARLISRTLLTDWRLGWDDCTYSFHDSNLCRTISANLQKTQSLWLMYAKTSKNQDYNIDKDSQVGTVIFGSFVIESQ